jgi:hypothetical protein
VADRVRNEVAVERGDAFRRLLTMIIATRVASGLVEVLHSMNLLRSGWIKKSTGGQVSWQSQCPLKRMEARIWGDYWIIGQQGKNPLFLVKKLK